MTTKEDVQKLAALSRIAMSEKEIDSFIEEFEGILEYVGQLEQLNLPADLKNTKPILRNVMRADGEPHAAGMHTEKLAEQFSAREGDALSVKQIISHD